ncbi:MAG TPA: type IV secretion protein Rhs [Blastocatellia bacterium]|nr:type IV secretion protein Rhs [Blastocatellia bacterium]
MPTVLNEDPTRQSGEPAHDYYAPNFKVLVDGGELSPETHGDVLNLKVTMDIANLTSFDLTINNWDDQSFNFKYSDKTTFDVGRRVDLQLGYADDLKFMVSGLVSTLTPRFPESGTPTLGVTGVDSLIKLRDRKPVAGDQRSFVNMSDSEIAQVIASRNRLKPQITATTEKHAQIVQRNQDDAVFLMERAKSIDFDCYIRVDPQSGNGQLFFVKPTDNRDQRRSRVFVFEWGKNLINFNPQITLHRQVGSVTVRGWNPATKEVITYTARSGDLPRTGGGGLTGPEAAQQRLGNRQEVVVDRPVASLQEAREYATSLLRERAYYFLTGSGQVIGLPDLRPGDNLELHQLGRRYSGPVDNRIQYYVTKVIHTLGNSGYQTQFEVRATADGGTEE